MEIGRYKTLGEISKGFLSALDIKYNVKKFERLSKEEKVDLEILSSETSSYLNDYSLKEYDLVSLENEEYFCDIIKNNFYELYRCYKKIILTEEVVFSQETLNENLVKKIIIPFLKNIFKEIGCKTDIKFLFDYTQDKENYFTQIKSNLLSELNLKNFNFMKKKNDEGKYRLINSLGKNEHSTYNLKELVNEFFEYDNVKNSSLKKENLFLNLILSKIYYSFLNLFLSENTKKTNKNSFNKEILNKIKEFEELTSFNKKNEEEDINKIEILYNFYIKNHPEHKWKVLYYYARHLIKKNELEKSLKLYEKAFKEGTYRAGKKIESIIIEGMVLYSKLKFEKKSVNKKTFKRFYKHAFICGLVNEKFQEGYLWMSEHYYKDFNQIFKKENFYETEKKENLKNRYFSSSFLHKNTVPNLDLKKLNKKYYFCERERTQLEIFSMIPGENIVYKENIEKLLEKMDEENNKGEKYDLVNFVNSTSQTPLIGAISAHNYDVALILLERKEITRTINQKSLRKKVTALSQFFLFLLEGNIEKNFKVIEKTLLKLIERGVDLNQKCTLDDCYPIQLIMNYIYSEQKKDLDYEEIIKKITNPETKNIYRRELYGSPFQKYFDKDLNKESVEKSGLPLFYIENNKHIPEIVKKNKDKLLRLIEIMLINGADVDLKWKKGISPIMYASEIGDLELFMLLSKYTKNIFQTTDKGLGLLTNSRGYGNDKVAEYLIKNYDSNKFSFYEIINNAIKSL